ncbi:Transposable element Tcb1 transposase [Cucumispora dikerogammari]|nr:Transposable element Tcb1 transposase [Cucumispora dikerogammari]
MGKRHALENITPTRKFGRGSIMVWGCISYERVGRIVLVDETMDSIRYARLLTENFFESASMMELGSNFIFQQDNAPAHTARHTAYWFRENGVNVLNWPAQSPDLNPIENIWSLMKLKFLDYTFTNKKILFEKITELWYEISNNYLKKLIESISKRIEECLRSKGRYTHY